MIDVATDPLIPLGEVCRRFGVTTKTARKWISDGLEARKVGGSWFTTSAALNAFAKPAPNQSTAVNEVKSAFKPSERYATAAKALKEEFGIG